MSHLPISFRLLVGAIVALVACASIDELSGRSAPRPTSRRVEPAPEAAPAAHVDPYAAAPCPSEVSIALKRTVDARVLTETLPGPYVKEHRQPVQTISRDDAIAKVLALEAKTPDVVPKGFRDELASHARDPEFRLFMARCELESSSTLRRASYDAALAFLLGADGSAVLPLVMRSFYPDGTGPKSKSWACKRDSECGDNTCDGLTGRCMSKEARVASFMSPAELDIEDTLVRTFATLDGPRRELTELPGEAVVREIAYGRYMRCSNGALCELTRGGDNRLETWDRRYHGESYTLTTTKAQDQEHECHDKTQHLSLASCRAACNAPSPLPHDSTQCLTRCALYCK